MISSDPTVVGTSRNSRKAYAWEVMQVIEEAHKHVKIGVVISFDDTDREGLKLSHDNLLVILHDR